MPPMRRPFVAPPSVASGDGQQPGMGMLQPGRMGPQPSTPMGGNPGMENDPMASGGGAPAPLGQAQAAAPANPSPGGPTSPLNIGQMLESRVGMSGGGQGGPMSGAPAAGAQSLPPWGDMGTRPSAPSRRVPVDPMAMSNGSVEGAGGGGDDDMSFLRNPASSTANMPAVMMQLLRKLGRV